MEQITQNSRVLADRFIKYVTKGISPYHAVQESKRILLEKGFSELKETVQWKGLI